jgi:tryptophan-rich sensory protein
MSDHALHLRRLDHLRPAGHGSDAPRAPQRSAGRHVVAAASFAVATAVAALVGGLVTASSMSWYDRLELPSFAPPDGVFGPVWSVLYSMVAVAGYLLWRSTTSPVPTVVWSVSMALNLGWTAVFFGLQRPAAAVAVIAALLVSIVAMVAISRRYHQRAAAVLFVPYAAWVAFAAVLNIAIARAN